MTKPRVARRALTQIPAGPIKGAPSRLSGPPWLGADALGPQAGAFARPF
jgi:hypothetical protein